MRLIRRLWLPILLLLSCVQAGAVTTNFNYSAANTPMSGVWTKQTFSNRNYVNYDTHVGSPYIDIAFTGTASLTLTVNTSAANAFNFSVDGGANVASSVGTLNAWTTVTVASGLSDPAAHTVRISINGSPASASIDLGTGSSGGPMLALTGSAPALTAPTTNGTKYTFCTPQQDLNAFGTSGCVEGGPKTSNTFWNTTVLKGQSIRFAGNPTSITLWCIGVGDSNSALSAPRVAVYQDGGQVGSDTTLSTTGGYQSIATGLDGNQHEWEILSTAGSFSFSYVSLGGGTLTAVTHTSHPIMAWYGDSITEGYGITDVRNNDAWIVSRFFGYYPLIQGTNGQKASTYGRDNTAQITGVSPAPAVVWLRWGHNDFATQVALGAVGTASTWTGDYHTMISNLQAGLPSTTLIICEGILPSTVTGTITLPQYDAYMQIAMAGFSRIVYCDTTGFLNPATGTGDGTHPNNTGYAQIAPFEEAYFHPPFRRGAGTRAGSRSLP